MTTKCQLLQVNTDGGGDTLRAEETTIETEIVGDLTEQLNTFEIVKIKETPKDKLEDIFQDMEPVISKPQIFCVKQTEIKPSNKFALIPEVVESSDGWGEDSDWNCMDVETEVTGTDNTSVR